MVGLVHLVLLISRRSFCVREIVIRFAGAVGPQLASSGKDYRGRFFPTPPPSHPSPVIYSTSIYWVSLECQTQCLGIWDQRWIDKALRLLEVQCGFQICNQTGCSPCEINCSSGTQNECFRSMGEEATAPACPNRLWHLSPPGAGSELQRLCLPPLSLGVQPSDSNYRNALIQEDGSLSTYLRSAYHMSVHAPLSSTLPPRGSFPVLSWSSLSDLTLPYIACHLLSLVRIPPLLRGLKFPWWQDGRFSPPLGA